MKVADGDATAEEVKQRGNDAFRHNQFAEAVGLYTKAIMLSKDNPIYYLNRSMAYMKLNKFVDAERDTTAAIRLDNNNVKALFRRGSARKQLEKWEEAQSDFESVVRLDSGNAEAKSELSIISERLQEEKQKLLRKSTGLQTREAEQTDSNRKLSSVEAARKFLEQVDVGKPSNGDIQKGPMEKESMPPRFPGESGAFLKEVSTRKIRRDEKETRDGESSIPDRHLNLNGNPNKKATMAQVTAKNQSSQSNKMSESQTGSSISQDSALTRGKLQLSAYQFFQELRLCSSLTEERGRISAQLGLLSSLDLSSFPSMLGSLLEPELLSELLQILLQADQKYSTMIIDLMSILPKCDRFETAWMFLNTKEKQVAEQIIAKLRLTNGDVAADSIKAQWGNMLKG